MEKLISVVIPTHNRKKLLIRAINSVQRQSYRNLEIIVVSDASTDGTNELVEEISKSDVRIKLISNSCGRGGNYARNLGIKEATSEYIAFLDDDDEWLPEKIEKEMKEFLKQKDVGLIYTGVNIIYENGNYQYVSIPQKQGDLSKEILIHNCIHTTSSVMIKKLVLEKAGYFDVNLSALQDYDLWIRCCQITHVGYVKECLVNYYINASANQITANTDNNHRAYEQVEFKYQDLYKTLSVKENKKRSCNKYCGLAKYALKNGEGLKCRKYAMHAFEVQHGITPLVIYILSFFGIENVLRIRRLIG